MGNKNFLPSIYYSLQTPIRKKKKKKHELSLFPAKKTHTTYLFFPSPVLVCIYMCSSVVCIDVNCFETSLLREQKTQIVSRKIWAAKERKNIYRYKYTCTVSSGKFLCDGTTHTVSHVVESRKEDTIEGTKEHVEKRLHPSCISPAERVYIQIHVRQRGWLAIEDFFFLKK